MAADEVPKLSYVQWRKQCQEEFLLQKRISWSTAMHLGYLTVDQAMSAHKRNMKPSEFVSTIITRWHEAQRKKAAR